MANFKVVGTCPCPYPLCQGEPCVVTKVFNKYFELDNVFPFKKSYFGLKIELFSSNIFSQGWVWYDRKWNGTNTILFSVITIYGLVLWASVISVKASFPIFLLFRHLNLHFDMKVLCKRQKYKMLSDFFEFSVTYFGITTYIKNGFHQEFCRFRIAAYPKTGLPQRYSLRILMIDF